MRANRKEKSVSRQHTLEKKLYPTWFAAPGLIIYVIIFVIPTFASFYFSLTKWNLRTSEFIGFENFKTFFTMANTSSALKNTAIYAFATCGLKVVIALLLAQYLCNSRAKHTEYIKVMYYLPSLLGNVAVAMAFESVLDKNGILNQLLVNMGFEAIKFLTDSKFALITCILIDVWKGIGTALIIYISGISAIPKDYYDAAAIDGASPVKSFFKITIPLLVPTINSVLTLSLIGGLRTYDLMYTLTGGGPGFSTELLGSAIYKLFSRGSYGLATAGYVIMFIVVSVIVFPLNSWVAKREAEL